MTALEAVASFLPPQRVPIAELTGKLRVSQIEMKLFERVHGLAEVRLDPTGTLTDLLTAALNQLDALRGREQQVRFVVHARSMPVAVPYPLNPLHEACAKAGLGHAVAFTVTQQACASGLLALDLLGRLLAGCGDPDAVGVLLAGEKTYTWDTQVIPGTTIFGEGAAACLVRADGPRDRVLSFATNIHGEFDGRMATMPELAAAFGRVYPDLLARVLLDAVARAGLTLADISLILPHNVNLVSWKRLCKAMDYPVERVVLDNVPLTGHSFCADAFINYATAVATGRLRAGDAYLMAAVGSGATFSAMVLRH